jgi:tetratricopeptide (TPR) repeat protein
LTFCTIVGSILVLFACSYYYHFSVFYNFKEIGYQQQQKDLKNEFVDFHSKLGIQFLYVEQIDAARNEFNQVLKVDPLNQNATRGLFECDVFSETSNKSYDPERTHIQLLALLKEYPNDPLPCLYIGDFAYNHDSYDDALNFYQKAINRSSSVAAAYFGMGLIYEERNKHDLARKMFQTAVNLSYWNALYRDNLAYTNYELKDYREALVWYNGSSVFNSNDLEPYVGYSNSYRCLGDLENAREIQEQQIGLMEDNSIANLTINQRTIFFPTNSGNIIYIYSYDVQKYYFYYNIALTYYLLGNETKTLEYLKKANDLHIDKDSKSNVKEIVKYDITNLQKAQPKLINKTNEFINKFE